MDIRVLYTILAIAEHGSFLAASRSLNLSPAAVSLHVKIIEDELGQTLFDRSVRPPVLTDAGRRTLERARRVVEAWEQLGQNDANDLAGTLALGAVPHIGAGLLAPAIARLRAQRPQLRVTLATDGPDELEERVARGMLDAAITVQDPAPALGLRFSPVRSESFRVVAPADAAGEDDEALLRSAAYARFAGAGWIARPIEQELVRRRLRLEPTMEIDSVSDALALVEAALVVSILPESAITPSRSEPVRTVPFGRPPLTRTIGLLRHSEHAKAAQTETLLEALLDVARSTRPREDQRVDAGDSERQTGEVAEVDAEDERPG